MSILLHVARLHQSFRAERGAAIVELTIAASLLLTLLLGIVSYGVLLSFKQGMTQVAAEAARAAAVEQVGKTPEQVAGDAATSAASTSLQKSCASDADGLTCTVTKVGGRVRVEVVYDNEVKPLVPPIPLLSSVLPKTLRSVSSVQTP